MSVCFRAPTFSLPAVLHFCHSSRSNQTNLSYHPCHGFSFFLSCFVFRWPIDLSIDRLGRKEQDLALAADHVVKQNDDVHQACLKQAQNGEYKSVFA